MFKNCIALSKVMLKSVFDSGASNIKINKHSKKTSKKSSKSSSLIIASIILVIFLGIPYLYQDLQ